ncbi:helix-turn-helix domain-containing protein [Nocardioides sp. NPDC047086]|uniref:TetR/AcrR family transcriptional regulator n=1 Tax=Nocardioides sp. NPDC047086 TaxID=3154810 RepID=UPI00340B6CC3
MTHISPRPGPGRPRRLPGPRAANPQEQLLDSAAETFVGQGYAGTTTREVAELAGMRQASLYYHFDGKEDLLAELLRRSFRHRVERARVIAAALDGVAPAMALYQLAASDVSALAAMPHNIGVLYRLPDVIASPVYGQFAGLRGELTAIYGHAGMRAAPTELAHCLDEYGLGELLVQLADAVTSMRAVGEIDPNTTKTIAAACLRQCGVSEKTIHHVLAHADDGVQ